MDRARNALRNLNNRMTTRTYQPPICFEEFLSALNQRPQQILRNVFQTFHDMITSYLGPGLEEYPDDPESIHYVKYDCSRLFEEDAGHPFFADRLFSNRLVSLVGSMKRGSQQNKVYIFNGPPGCGKSTFFNNILEKFEAYANSEEGLRYEIFWKLDPKLLGFSPQQTSLSIVDQISLLLQENGGRFDQSDQIRHPIVSPDGTVNVACPSHDFPLLIIPKKHRRALLHEIFDNTPFGNNLFSEPEYAWVLREKPCTICSAIYRALHNQLKDSAEVHKMIFARPYRFYRRIGEGISVFSPGDTQTESPVYRNSVLASNISMLLKEPMGIQYIYSRYARTNNGIYALMDIKSHNVERFIELHNIISEGLHKVENVEENVNSLFLAVMNPEDQKNIADIKSFSDRIEYINIPYVMDINTEVKIYCTIFGKQIESHFLPRVLDNFARVIISTRLSTVSDALREWISDPGKYSQYCDNNLQLLKMEIYAGVIPPWLSEEDRKNLTAKRRRRIIAESDLEGNKGVSGRDSIKIFNEFYSTYARHDKLITMSMLNDFFRREKANIVRDIPDGFLESLLRMYNYTVLQEVKESLFFYNEREITRDILNYIFAINFEPPTQEVCTFTGDKIDISEDFFNRLEKHMLGSSADLYERRRFREDAQREYTSKTLTQELMVEKKEITATAIYQRLLQHYFQNIKEKALDPFLENENFRRAIKDFGTPDFKTYDERLQVEIRSLLHNLNKIYGYSELGAKEVCIYVIDNNLGRSAPVEEQSPME